MATKKATYKYDNGTDWDEIMFKTTADQVVESTTKRFVTDTEKSNWNDARTKALDWNTFKTSGGTISGTITIGEYLYFKSGDKFLRENGTDIAFGTSGAIRAALNYTEFRPNQNNSINLGSNSFRWKDVYVGNFSKSTSGYTKLPNGMILQWVYGDWNQDGSTSRNFPIAFPTACLSVTVTCKEANERSVSVSSLTNTTIKLKPQTYTYCYILAIGY